jgi:hypothetical protein
MYVGLTWLVLDVDDAFDDPLDVVPEVVVVGVAVGVSVALDDALDVAPPDAGVVGVGVVVSVDDALELDALELLLGAVEVACGPVTAIGEPPN